MAGNLTGIARADLIHHYGFNGNYADSQGGPALTPGGPGGVGTLSGTDYSFEANQGLTLANALPSGDSYSILVDFSFSSLDGYRKIVDFNLLTTDAGLYNLSTALNFYPVISGGSEAFSPDGFVRLVVTRDAMTAQFTGYLNGLQQFSFVDTQGLAIFADANKTINFFNDDGATSHGEASKGVVNRIDLYDGPLTAGQVQALGAAAVPEPGTFALVGAGLAAIIAARRLRRTK